MTTTIEQVEVFGIKMPLLNSFTTGGVAKSDTKALVVRLTASDGAIGISSVDATTNSPDTVPELTETLRERIAPALIGNNSTNIHQILELTRSLALSQPSAVVAIEMAAIDLTCQQLDLPLYDYLGGAVEERLALNGWIGMLPPDEAAVEAQRWLDAGFLSSKIKVGSGVTEDRDRIEAVRATVGNAMQLRIDANQQYDAAGALELCKLVKQFDLQFFEQPTAKDDLEGMARVRREGGIPVMADESISDHESLMRVIRAECADFVKFGIQQAGGLLRSAHMVETAEAAGLPVVMGHGFSLDLSTMAEIMLGATSRNFVSGLECVGPLKVVDTVTTDRLDIGTGSIELPLGPGLGLMLDEEKLEQYRYNEAS
tara:strand:- start:2816 stop:3928 length:1113 start_codon:yes stop_codon:yes gene_type:complete